MNEAIARKWVVVDMKQDWKSDLPGRKLMPQICKVRIGREER